MTKNQTDRLIVGFVYTDVLTIVSTWKNDLICISLELHHEMLVTSFLAEVFNREILNIRNVSKTSSNVN
jgi:hypothetical protein